MAETDVGNVAAMREAAEKLVKYLPKFIDAINYYGVDGYYKVPYEQDLKELRGRMDFLKSALAAPPRNCDVGTADEQSERFLKFCESHPHCANCELDVTNCEIAWTQMSYDGGKE